jgi:hypothetical protein
MMQNEDPLDSTTVHRSEYQAKKGDRYAKKTPVNASGELLRGDGSFLSETSQNAEYRAGKGDRYETKRRGSSDIWKVLHSFF